MRLAMRSDRRDSDQQQAPSFLQTLQSVLAAFFGVQSSRNRVRDFKHGKPLHIVLIGLLATGLFVLLVVLAVKLALALAGV